MGFGWGKHAHSPLDEFIVVPLSAVPNSRNSKTENFLFLFQKKFGRATSKKCRENFSVLGRKLLQSLRAESGAEPKSRNRDFPQKKF